MRLAETDRSSDAHSTWAVRLSGRSSGTRTSVGTGSGSTRAGAGQASGAADAARAALAEGNRRYQAKFGWIFIVCATGKSADEMIAMLGQRLNNGQAEELHIAAAEQEKITLLRLQKLGPSA